MKSAVWTTNCLLDGSLVISVIFHLSCVPSKEDNMFSTNFSPCKYWSAWGSCSPGWCPSDSTSAELQDLQEHTVTPPSVLMLLCEWTESTKCSGGEKDKREEERAGLPSSLFRSTLAPFHTFWAKPLFVCSVAKYSVGRSWNSLSALYWAPNSLEGVGLQQTALGVFRW